MFKLQVGKEVKFKIPKGDSTNIYRVFLTYDEREELVPIVYWTEHDGFVNGGATVYYSLCDVEEWLNNGSWVRIE